MPRCKWCKKRRFITQLTDNGLCQKCNSKIGWQIFKFGEQYRKAQRKLDFFYLPGEAITLIDEIKGSLKKLYKFEKKKIPTMLPLPSDLLKMAIYTIRNETLSELETRLRKEIQQGIATFPDIFIHGSILNLSGIFKYNSQTNTYLQINNKVDKNAPIWTQYHKLIIQFSENVNAGVYKEYYKSGKLRREVPFIIDTESGEFKSNGADKIYYEDKDSDGNYTYSLVEETKYQNGEVTEKNT